MTSAATENTSAPISRKEKALLVLLLILAVLSFHQLVIGKTKSDFLPGIVDAFFFVSGTSPQFLYVLVTGLLFIRRKDIAKAYHEKGSPWSALLFLLPGICLFLWGHFVNAMDIIHVSFVLISFGAARYLSGKKLTRTILAPTLILVLATPLPAAVINQVIFPMQLWDTEHSVWLLNTIGIASLAKGDLISMAEGNARFAESCTALGFILWLTIFALAYVYIFRITRWHAVLLVLSAPFIAYAVNILRALSLVLNPDMEVLTIHTLQGIAFFLVGFSLLYAVDNVLMHSVGDGDGEHKEAFLASGNNEISSPKQGKLYLLACLLVVLFIVSVIIPKWSAPSTDTYPPISLDDELGEWKLTANLPVKYLFLGSVRYSSTLHREYRRNNQPVYLFVGIDDRLRRHRSLLSQKNGYQDRIGLVLERSMINLGPDLGDAVAIVTDYSPWRMLTYHWYEGIDNIAKEILYALLALDQSPFRREEPAKVTRVATYIELTPEGRMLADKRLREFLREIKTSETIAAPLN